MGSSLATACASSSSYSTLSSSVEPSTARSRWAAHREAQAPETVDDSDIANPEIDYGAGWDYEHTLSWLAQHPDADIHAFAAAEAEIWDAHHAAAGAEDGLLRSHAAIEMDAVPEFIAAFAAFTSVFRSTASSAVSVGRAAYFSLRGYWAEDLTCLSASANLRDAGQFLAAMSQSDDGESAQMACAAAAALDAAILDHVSGALRSPFGQAGVHMELPSATDAAARLDEVVTRWWLFAPAPTMEALLVSKLGKAKAAKL